jgi:hypothetical protein
MQDILFGHFRRHHAFVMLAQPDLDSIELLHEGFRRQTLRATFAKTTTLRQNYYEGPRLVCNNLKTSLKSRPRP